MYVGIFVLSFPESERESSEASRISLSDQADRIVGRGSVGVSNYGQRSLAGKFGPCQLGLLCTGTVSFWDLKSLLSRGV